MTFEEFFQKKKIDLLVFGSERPALLAEFREHFEAMGEKSFDHTKKYWFNKLRKSYPLKELPAPKTATRPAAAPSTSAPAASGAGGTASNPPKPGFKPRFKAGKTAVTPKPEQPGLQQPGPEQPGLQQPGPQQPAQKESPDTNKEDPHSVKAEGEQPKSPKPAYKPRFKPGVTRINKKDNGE